MSHIATCPRCSSQLRVSEQITDKTLICPYCLANVNNPWPGSQIRFDDINTDVKRDMGTGGIVLGVLIGLCILGIAMALIATRGWNRVISLMYLFAPLDVLVSITIIRGLVRRNIFEIRTPSVGGVFGIVFLSLGTIVAVIVFFFYTCFFLASLKAEG